MKSIRIYTITAGLLFVSIYSAFAQNNTTGSLATEVYLSFQYRGVVSEYVTAYYKNDEFYLPVSQLFNSLQINHSVDQGSLQVSGIYPGEIPYHIDFASMEAEVKGTVFKFRADDILIRDIDYFMKADLFYQFFGLSFTVDFNTLSLHLETEDEMPVLVRHERQRRREQIRSVDYSYFDRTRYPLKYGRAPRWLDGGFLDYSLSAIHTPQSQLLNLNNSVGLEVLGGDLQGSSFASLSADHHSLTTTNLRWRYVQRDNPLFTSGTIGQTSTEGLAARSLTGAQISNKPVEPRLLFDRYVIDGQASPQSEVELYLNNSFVNFQQTDETGEYRFVVPLTYGTTDYSVRIYTQTGQTHERGTRIQIPFDYVPPGKIDYSLSAGKLHNAILGMSERGIIGEATVAAGLTEWLTAKTSAEYLSSYHTSLPTLTGSLSARLFSNYLISADASSENFYRLSSSVIYGNGASWSMNYDYNPDRSRLYNVGGTEQQARLNLFLPLSLGKLPLNFRWSSTYQKHSLSHLLRYRMYLNSRFRRLTVRLGYHDQQVYPFSFNYSPVSRLIHSYTYTVGRRPGTPDFLRGMFIRGQLSYLPSFKQLEEVELRLSRSVFGSGHLQLTYGHNFIGDFNSLSLNMTIDFNRFRSNTSTRRTGSAYTLSQNFRGSVGFHPYDSQFMLNNRQQVGQAGAAVRLFVDNNNDGAYQPDIDDLIDDPAIRLNRAGGRLRELNGINYVSQLLPYQQYDVEINKSVLTNPLLVPEIEQFSIVTDPNRYKPIDIPFYLSGVISGKIEQLQQNHDVRGLGGVRLYLESRKHQEDDPGYFIKEIRTFADGSFYTYEVPPGKYNMYIDPNQLEFLNSFSSPDTLQLEVQALSQGDFVEDLSFRLTPNGMQQEEALADRSLSKDITTVKDEDNEYQIQLASFSTPSKARRLADIANHYYGLQFEVIRNHTNGLFAVRSSSFKDRNKAVDHLIAIQNNGSHDAALVIVKNKLPAEFRDLNTAELKIQIGAFTSKQRARAYAALSSIKLDRQTTLQYDNEIGLYTVFFSNPVAGNSGQIYTLLRKIRRNSYFRDAFIKNNKPQHTSEPGRPMQFSFEVQIEGGAEQSSLTAVIDQSDISHSRTADGLVIIENIDDWRKAQQLRKKLSEITSDTIPIVVLIEE